MRIVKPPKIRCCRPYKAGEPEISVLAQSATHLFNTLIDSEINTNFDRAQTDLLADGELDQPIFKDIAEDF